MNGWLLLENSFVYVINSSHLQSSTKRGKWCTAHVRIAWLIYQKQHPNAAADPSKHLQQAKERASGAANEGTAASKRPSVIQETRPGIFIVYGYI